MGGTTERMACLAAAIALATVGAAADSVAEMLAKPHFLFEESDAAKSLRFQFYNEAYMRICSADRAADQAWLALKSPAEVRAHQQRLSAKMVEMIGGLPERTPLNPVVTGTVKRRGYRVEKVLFESRPRFFVTGHVYVPEGVGRRAPFPAVLVPCGHSLSGKNSECYGNAGAMGALNGFVTLVYDPIDQGERHQRNLDEEKWVPGVEHNRVGWRCQILGWGAAQLHIWDGMRALDYLASRKDVDAERIGVTGMSGGGTLTSYLMALDPRVRSGCPAGYVTSLRDLCTFRGPQDHEQDVQGMLTFGLNQLGYVLMRAPQPELLGFSHNDFFPIIGSLETLSNGRRVYGTFGAEERLQCISEDGEHHWYIGTRTAQFDWLRRWLADDMSVKLPMDPAWYRKLNVGFDFRKMDCGLARDAGNRLVTRDGRALNLPGARSVYDVLRDEADRQERRRRPVTPEVVRAATGIRPLAAVPYEALDVSTNMLSGGVMAVKATLYRTCDSLRVPAITFVPPQAKGPHVLYMAYSHGREGIAPRVERFLAEGRPVTVADVRASGETWKGYHTFCGAGWEGEEELAMMYMWLGENLVAHRTEDALVAARYVVELNGGKAVDLVASGVMAVPAAHAFYLEPQFFGSLSLENPCASWRKVLDDPQQDFRYAAAVYGAFARYDWIDLAKR